jgi:hypothetical protein
MVVHFPHQLEAKLTQSTAQQRSGAGEMAREAVSGSRSPAQVQT